MTDLTFLKADPDEAAREEYCLAADKLIAGKPKQVVWNTIPRGFTGTWEVVEPTRKIYVIYEAGE